MRFRAPPQGFRYPRSKLWQLQPFHANDIPDATQTTDNQGPISARSCVPTSRSISL